MRPEVVAPSGFWLGVFAPNDSNEMSLNTPGNLSHAFSRIIISHVRVRRTALPTASQHQPVTHKLKR